MQRAAFACPRCEPLRSGFGSKEQRRETVKPIAIILEASAERHADVTFEDVAAGGAS